MLEKRLGDASIHWHSKNCTLLHTKTNENEYSLHMEGNYHQVDLLQGWRCLNETTL